MADKPKNEPVDVPARATPVEPGKPVEAKAVTQMGGTFAERAGKKAPPLAEDSGSTFADRAKAAKKAVKADDAEDKSVSRTSASKKSK